jgi:putative transcription factor
MNITNITQDWNVITWDKRGQKSKNESQKTFMNNQMRKNNTTSHLKNVKPNENKINSINNIKKIENEEESFKHEKISLSVSKKIAQARCDKKISQKELAIKLNLPLKIIQDYESGKGIPNHIILNKIEKVLEKRVRD